MSSKEQDIDQARERLRPRALLSSNTNAAHLVSVVVAVTTAAVAAWATVAAPPSSLPLILVVVPAALWFWLSLRAIKANAKVLSLCRSGELVRGRVTAVETQPEGGVVHYRFHVVPHDADVPDLDALDAFALEGRERGIGRTAMVRYHVGMQVAVVFAEDGADSALVPPPGGGTPLDLLGDVFAAVARRVDKPTRSPTPADPDSR